MSTITFNRQQARCLSLGEWKWGQGGMQLKTKKQQMTAPHDNSDKYERG